jgi:uncharacterized membrane protein YedE/YeeE
MNGDTKIGVGLVGLVALCCGGPLIVSLITSGVLLGALGTLWAGSQLPFLLGSAIVILAGLLLFGRRRAIEAPRDAARCATPERIASGPGANESVHENDHVTAR